MYKYILLTIQRLVTLHTHTCISAKILFNNNYKNIVLNIHWSHFLVNAKNVGTGYPN